MTQDRRRWKVKPGSFDSLNSSLLFPSSNAYGIPDLDPAPLSALPERLLAYRTRLGADFDPATTAAHFWLDDFRFETVWNRPQKALQGLSRFRTALTPDFSIYRDWPRAMQIWNIYRARWCGRLWAEAGFQVIPAVSWGRVETFDFCFLGLPAHSLLAVSAVGLDLRQPRLQKEFLTGFREMVHRLAPTKVLAYGRIPAACQDLAQVITFPTRWEKIKG